MPSNSIDMTTTMDLDRPLLVDNALAEDVLDREAFAASVVAALGSVSAQAGLVISIEGEWGSGKSSALALVQALLHKLPDGRNPRVVHFNPWLIGERDALLKLFLEKLASAAEQQDKTGVAVRAAQELRSYAHLFGVVKFIPGAEPWASLAEAVFRQVGKTASAVAELKTPDLEEQRNKVADALRQLPNPVVVFVDDIDRLMPQEVYEVVRIIKAVGELPNVGYVVAWDAEYVSEALNRLSVPLASTYPDKVVQVRLPLPALSHKGREQLMNRALESLGDEVTKLRFPNEKSRLGKVYWSGLRDLLSRPRDFSRVFNVLRASEPSLRGEVAFADQLGLAALKVKAAPLYALLLRHPTYFVGSMRGDPVLPRPRENEQPPGKAVRERAYAACDNPRAARELAHQLFPFAAKEDGAFSMERWDSADGSLGVPERLALAIQAGLTDRDASISMAQRYLQEAHRRVDIIPRLNAHNCMPFLALLGSVAASHDVRIDDVAGTAVDIARMAESEAFLQCKAMREAEMTFFHSEDLALQVAAQLSEKDSGGDAGSVAARLAQDKVALSVAAQLLSNSYTHDRGEAAFVCRPEDRHTVVDIFASHVVEAAQRGELERCINPGLVLRCLSRLKAEACPPVFDALRRTDPTLDGFAMTMLLHSIHSPGGRAFKLSDEPTLAAFVDVDLLRAHARARLDAGAKLPAKAAWMSLLDGQAYFGDSGLNARV